MRTLRLVENVIMLKLIISFLNDYCCDFVCYCFDFLKKCANLEIVMRYEI